MNRDKYPEKVPFRLTRMLIKAMEVSGIEGSYRSTCERTMTVLRESRDSLVAMLEAFLYDPLISWRLVDLSNNVDGVGRLSNNITTQNNNDPLDADGGVPIDPSSRTGVLPISEGDEDDDEEDDNGGMVLPDGLTDQIPSVPARRTRDVAISATRARSLQMYSNIQTWAANLGADGRIASIAGGAGGAGRHRNGPAIEAGCAGVGSSSGSFGPGGTGGVNLSAAAHKDAYGDHQCDQAGQGRGIGVFGSPGWLLLSQQ